MPKKLTVKNFQELEDWLYQHGIAYKNINRNFSNALPMATLLKKLYPKLVDLHNYPANNSTHLKYNNWETLNKKVLPKLGLWQNNEMLAKLAKGVPGVIENLLYDVMLINRTRNCKNNRRDDKKLWVENDEITTAILPKNIGNKLIEVPQKMILYSIYEQARRDLQNKNKKIKAVQQKIVHLENVIKLKSDRIYELSIQLARETATRTLSNHDIRTAKS